MRGAVLGRARHRSGEDPQILRRAKHRRGFLDPHLRGDRIGVVGANGAGKTTLIGLLTGALSPDSAKLRLGAGIAMATLEQGRASLDPERSLQDR